MIFCAKYENVRTPMTISTPRQLMSGSCCRRLNSAMASGVGPRLVMAAGRLAAVIGALDDDATVFASADAFASFFFGILNRVGCTSPISQYEYCWGFNQWDSRQSSHNGLNGRIELLTLRPL